MLYHRFGWTPSRSWPIGARALWPVCWLVLVTAVPLQAQETAEPPIAEPVEAEPVPTRPSGEAPAPEQMKTERGRNDRTRFARWFYRDLGALAKETFTVRTGLAAAGGIGATFALAWLDDDIQHGMHGLYKGSVRDVLEVVDYLGGPRINLPVVLVAGGSLLTNDARFQDAAFTSLQTLVYAGLLGYTLKGIFGRARPEATDDPYAFFATTGKNPFSHEGNSSYPSGHAIAAFGIVTPWVVYYPSVLTYGLYVLPAGTALSRLAVDKHWATDIVVGAAIGVLMGRWLAHRHLDRSDKPETVELSLGEPGRLFTLKVRL